MTKLFIRGMALIILALVVSTSAHASWFHHEKHRNPHYHHHAPKNAVKKHHWF